MLTLLKRDEAPECSGGRAVTQCHLLGQLLAPLSSHQLQLLPTGDSMFSVAGEGLWKAGRSPELCGRERPTHLLASSSSLLPEGEKETFWNGDRGPKAARAARAGGRAGSKVSRSPGDVIPFSSQVLQVRLVASNLPGPRPEFPGFPPP